LDVALLDGPHAYPLPQIELAYLFPHIRVGVGWRWTTYKSPRSMS
jgi:hypothetical protein